MSKMARRLSQGSTLVSSYIRDVVSKDIRQEQERGLPFLETLSSHSLTLPLGAGENLEDDPFLTDKRMRVALEEARLINWCPGIKKQVPLSVSNDGNTLCHSASMAIWGIHDRNLDLRQLLAQALQSEVAQEFRKRWQKEVIASRKKMEGLNYEHDMEAEWQVLIELASKANKSLRSSSPMYEPLEEFHIFVLANVLRRPILVFADRPIKSVEPEEMTSSFSAIYLPLLWPSQQCCLSPLVLGYTENYFSPLITFGSVLEDANTNEPCPTVVPLVKEDLIPIETRYFLPEEESNKEALLKEYLLLGEIESTKTGKVTQVLTVAKLVFSQLAETQQLISEFLRLREPKPQDVKVASQPTRKTSRFSCGNKMCSNFIDKDHLFPYCSECHPKFSSSLPKTANPTRRKMNSANTVVAPTTLEVECATIDCPYYAAVNCFPYCQRCYSKQRSQQAETTSNESSHNTDALENRWQKLAMGIVDQEVVAGITSTNSRDDEIIFANLHRHLPLEDGEKCAMGGGVTSTRSQPADHLRQQNKVSATGARSGPQRKISREELELATNTVNLDDWKRKISWINEPCIRTGCSYFASARTYPYCNQCAQEMQSSHSVPPSQRNRKVSATCSLSTLVQED